MKTKAIPAPAPPKKMRPTPYAAENALFSEELKSLLERSESRVRKPMRDEPASDEDATVRFNLD